MGLSAGGVAGSSGFNSGLGATLAAATSFLAPSSLLARESGSASAAAALAFFTEAASLFGEAAPAAEARGDLAGLSAISVVLAGEAARFSISSIFLSSASLETSPSAASAVLIGSIDMAVAARNRLRA